MVFSALALQNKMILVWPLPNLGEIRRAYGSLGTQLRLSWKVRKGP